MSFFDHKISHEPMDPHSRKILSQVRKYIITRFFRLVIPVVLFLLLGIFTMAPSEWIPNAISKMTTSTESDTQRSQEKKKIETQYHEVVKPLLQAYCWKCHGAKLQEADIDLQKFETGHEYQNGTKIWQKVLEMVESEQMPPIETTAKADKKSLSSEQRRVIVSWVRTFLKEEAKARAGDPGKVVLRRLSNQEYTWTIRDLTGIDSLDPAREFPVDGAAGEGFTNAGNALVMSPALLSKYFTAAKEVAQHLVLLPDGFRFSPSTFSRDWTNESLARIRSFYNRYTIPGNAGTLKMPGIEFFGSSIRNLQEGGVVPLEDYLRELIKEKEKQNSSLEQKQHGNPTPVAQLPLNQKYLGILRDLLNKKNDPNFPSPILDTIRHRFQNAKLTDVTALAKEIHDWQQILWKFNSIGHIGKIGGPTSWLQPLSPLQEKVDYRLKMPISSTKRDITLYLLAHDAGDGAEHDWVVWNQPRFVAANKEVILLKDVAAISQWYTDTSYKILGQTDRYLQIVEEWKEYKKSHPDLSNEKIFAYLQQKYSSGIAPSAPITNKDKLVNAEPFDPEILQSWLEYLNVISLPAVEIKNHFNKLLPANPKYSFVTGWGEAETPLVIANSSDQLVHVPGMLKPHSIAVHPSPTKDVIVSWRSPIEGAVKVQAEVAHAHPECGNGITWSLEHWRGNKKSLLASGVAQGRNQSKIKPIDSLQIRPGELIALVIGPRDRNHSCDLTAVDLTIQFDKKQWNLGKEVSGNILQANPHPDSYQNKAIWNFHWITPEAAPKLSAVIPSGSLIERWQKETNSPQKNQLALLLKKHLLSHFMKDFVAPGQPQTKDPASKISPADQILLDQLASHSGPILGTILSKKMKSLSSIPNKNQVYNWGIDPARFGNRQNFSNQTAKIDSADLSMKAPEVIAVRIPAKLVAGYEFVTSASLDPVSKKDASVQVMVSTELPNFSLQDVKGLLPIQRKDTNVAPQLGPDSPQTINTFSAPILVAKNSNAYKYFQKGIQDFQNIFPIALCYTKIVPVDEAVTLTVFYREDQFLCNLMLSASEKRELDRLWDDLHFISKDAFALVDGLEQIIQFSTQDGDPKVFIPLRKPFQERANQLKQILLAAEPVQRKQLLPWAKKAFRRPLLPQEKAEIESLYQQLRAEGLSHAQAMQWTIARILISPSFLYKREQANPIATSHPISDWELAVRLSYFLWSSLPDDILFELAAQNRLHQPEILSAQIKRMIHDDKIRRCAIEFGCQAIHIRNFDQLNEKSEKHYPEFATLRKAMYEESILFWTYIFQNNCRIGEILNSDVLFVNGPLAKFYGIPGIQGESFQKINNARAYGRGGILGLATTLASQSGASRTSPILRGNWVSEVLLGEKLPKPPKGVPQLPEDESQTSGLTMRQLVEKHTRDSKCSVCHRRIDAYGFALEGFDTIGRRRQKNLSGQKIDTKVQTIDGAIFSDLDGLRNYLWHQRKEAFTRQFCKKLLGYALGRGAQLGDEPILDLMQQKIANNEDHLENIIEVIVQSKPFREIRGTKFIDPDE